jgi:hypothetical protein
MTNILIRILKDKYLLTATEVLHKAMANRLQFLVLVTIIIQGLHNLLQSTTLR